MAKLMVGIGMPGSGKTTILKNFAERYGYAYICPDDIRQELLGDVTDNSRNNEVWAEAYKRTREHLQEGKSIVFDATFADPEYRKAFLKFARENGAEKIQGIFVDVPSEVARARNQARDRKVPNEIMDRMESDLKTTPPELQDGFDAIFTLDEYQKMVSAEVGQEQTMRKEFQKSR